MQVKFTKTIRNIYELNAFPAGPEAGAEGNPHRSRSILREALSFPAMML
jgi:hypothetical protein